jgi:hypothetical protein
MNDKKKIDKLFKEQLKNFEVTPKDYVWENIEQKLHGDKRKKRRIIPIWWKVAGVAASLLVLFTIANPFFNTSGKDSISNEIIVDESEINDSSTIQDQTNTIKQNDPSKEILQNDASKELVGTNSKTSAENKEEVSSMNKNKSNLITSDTNINPVLASESSNTNKPKEKTQNTVPSNTSNFIKSQEEKRNTIDKPSTKDAIVSVSKSSSQPNEAEQTTAKEKLKIDNTLLKSNDTYNKSTVADTNTNEGSEIENKPLEDDSQNKEKEETNAIENAIAEAENTDEKEEEEEKLNRWSVSPNVAPVYFSSLGEGSSIDAQFNNNNKETEISMSYGIAGSYAINNKLKIRAGINKVDLGYTTNDILIFENSNQLARTSNQMDNVNMASDVGRYSIYSANSFKFENAPATLFTLEQGSIDQELGFIEVPIELEYNVIENKIGLNLIGGFSALFLNENDIYAVLNNSDRTRLGEASNINDFSYTANFGIGLDYNFSKQFQFNLDPTFKYQINTFNNTSGNFNPFFIGVYTGLSYKF